MIIRSCCRTGSAAHDYPPWSLEKQSKTLFPISSKTVERLILGYSKQALWFIISWHSLRTTYVSRSVELEQSPAVMMANTGDSAAAILKHYAKLPEVVMRKFVENKPVIPSERLCAVSMAIS